MTPRVSCRTYYASSRCTWKCSGCLRFEVCLLTLQSLYHVRGNQRVHQAVFGQESLRVVSVHKGFASAVAQGAHGSGAIEAGNLFAEASIDHAVFKDKAIPFEKFSSIHPSKAAAGILEMAGYESLKSHSDTVFPSHIMLAICHTSGSAGSDLLESYGVAYNSLRDRFSAMGALQRNDSERETKKTFGAITDKLVELINPESKNITYTS